MRQRTGLFSAAMESIHFQTRDFFNAMVEAVSVCRNDRARYSNPDEYFKSPGPAEVIKCIKSFTNLKMEFMVPWCDYGPAIIPIYFSESHVLAGNFDPNNEVWKANVAAAFKVVGNEKIKGSIDLKSARVTGDFEKISFQLLLPKDFLQYGDMFQKTMSAEEAAAVILHEVGHAFTSLEYLNRTITTNQILAELSRARPIKEKYDVLITRVAKENDYTSEAVVALTKAKNDQDLVTIVYGEAIQRAVSELGASVFDITACEQLADQFAVRCGAGAHLASSLAKIPELRQTKGHTLLANIRLVIVGAVFAFVNVPAAIYIFVLLLTGALLSNKKSEIYGTFHSRMSRIRVELVTALKNSDIAAADRVRINKEIEILDEIIDQEDEVLPLVQLIAYYLKPGFRAAHKYERLQRELEDMSVNPLFVKASKLREIAASPSNPIKS